MLLSSKGGGGRDGRGETDSYYEDYDELDEARDFQALVPFLIQLLPIGAAYVLGTALLPALAWPLGLAVVAFLVAANTVDDEDD